MNPVIENLLTRRSIRGFTHRPVAKEDLQTIVNTAIYAPSGMNRQTWQFTVIDHLPTIEHLAKVVGKADNRGEDYDFYKPTAVIIATNHRESRHGCADCSCALQNIFLAAHSLGIGSVWINQLNATCDNPEVRDLLTKVGIPTDHVVYGMAALGYAALPPKEPNKNTQAICFYQPK
ncbi:MAG: nitroreductase [Clostridia bacterium]|nr:nitroreductase [Clostridia bacterium]